VVESLIIALLLTELIELTIAWLLGLRGRDLMAIGLINVITNPVLNYLLLLTMVIFHPAAIIMWVIVLLFEVVVVIIEAGLIGRFVMFRKIKPLSLSLILNIASFISGVIIGGVGL